MLASLSGVLTGGLLGAIIWQLAFVYRPSVLADDNIVLLCLFGVLLGLWYFLALWCWSAVSSWRPAAPARRAGRLR